MQFASSEAQLFAVSLNKKLVDKEGNSISILPSKFSLATGIKNDRNAAMSAKDDDQSHTQRENKYLAHSVSDSKDNSHRRLGINVGEGKR